MSKADTSKPKSKKSFFNRAAKAVLYTSAALFTVGVARAAVDDYSQFKETGDVMGTTEFVKEAAGYAVETPKDALELLL